MAKMMRVSLGEALGLLALNVGIFAFAGDHLAEPNEFLLIIGLNALFIAVPLGMRYLDHRAEQRDLRERQQALRDKQRRQNPETMFERGLALLHTEKEPEKRRVGLAYITFAAQAGYAPAMELLMTVGEDADKP
jgi:multisubunit Na+/H+ antiporter MnhG subunit